MISITNERQVIEALQRIADALERIADASTKPPAPVTDEGEAPSAGAGHHHHEEE